MSYPEFLKASPFKMARRYADREMRGVASASEITWLHEHPVAWLRALTRTHLDVKDHIAKSKQQLSAAAPPSGKNPSREYLGFRKQWLAERTSRLHFQGILENKMEEVKGVIGSDHFAATISAGDLVSMFVEFIELVEDDDIEAIRGKAQFLIRRLTES